MTCVQLGSRPRSREEFSWSVNMLFWLFFYHPIMRSRLLPIPLTRLAYKALGAQVGAGTYFSGYVFDPHFFEIGEKCIVGADSLIVPHILEGATLAHALIPKGSHIRSNEIWGGVPAKKIGMQNHD